MNSRLDKISLPFEDFNIALDNNSKILFSGIFGSGKTTFINDFFRQSEDYLNIHIYPVNYSIVSNEDIFELIKHDILFQLLSKIPKQDFEKIEIPYELTLWQYLIDKNEINSKIDFLAPFLNFAGKYGSGINKVFENLKVLKKNYDEFHSKFQSNSLNEISTYLEKSTKTNGHIYEEDFFTELIRELISNYKSKNENKEVVLVIDDLDRLDPDHIFRLLNIFSAHIDFRGNENDNKFDFDKVILVCDYDNICSVFKYRHGEKVDFEGYIDKFYTNVYRHNTSTHINKIIDSYINSIDLGSNLDILEARHRIGSHIRFVFNELIRYNLINFRDLINYNMELNLNYQNSSNYQNRRRSLLNSFNLNSETVIYFFHSFFDNPHKFNSIISKAELKEIDKGYDSYDKKALNKIVDLVILMNHFNYAGNSFSIKPTNTEKEIFYYHNNDEYCFNIIIIDSYYSLTSECKSITKNGEIIEDLDINYFTFLKEAVEVFIDYYKDI